MAKKAFESLSETMLYTLMAFTAGEKCGTDVSNYVNQITDGRLRMGPGTLYTILASFQSEGLIEKRREEGRRITYGITEQGRAVYENELKRLRLCLRDAERVQGGATHEQEEVSASAV